MSLVDYTIAVRRRPEWRRVRLQPGLWLAWAVMIAALLMAIADHECLPAPRFASQDSASNAPCPDSEATSHFFPGSTPHRTLFYPATPPLPLRFPQSAPATCATSSPSRNRTQHSVLETECSGEPFRLHQEDQYNHASGKSAQEFRCRFSSP